MKIVFPMLSLAGYGGEKIVTKLCNGLIERGHEAVIVIPPRANFGVFHTDAEIIESGPVRYNVPYLDIITSKNMISYIPECDIICNIFGTLSHVSIAACKKHGKSKKVINYAQDFEARFCYKWRQFGYRRLIKKSYKKFDLNIVTADWLDEEIFRFTGRRSVKINPGIDLDKFYKRKAGKENFILHLGREQPYKGLADFLRAGELVNKEIEIPMKIVSRNPINIETSVPFENVHPNDDELAELYSSCRLYVLSSWFEGYGAPPLEAMACGADVVTTDCMGVSEFAKDGWNCLLAEPKNPKDLSEKMMMILKNEKLSKKLSINGLATAKKFSYKRMVGKFEKVCLSIL